MKQNIQSEITKAMMEVRAGINDKQELFELGIFDEPGGELTVIDGTLSWESALREAEIMFKTGKYFGIEIVSADPNDMEPIKLTLSKTN